MVRPSDEDLVRALGVGEEEAMRLLLRRHEGPVRSWLSVRLFPIEDFYDLAARVDGETVRLE